MSPLTVPPRYERGADRVLGGIEYTPGAEHAQPTDQYMGNERAMATARAYRAEATANAVNVAENAATPEVEVISPEFVNEFNAIVTNWLDHWRQSNEAK